MRKNDFKKKALVVVIEQDYQMRDLLCAILQNEGYQTVSAENAEKAYLLLEQNKADVIIIDIDLPDQDGCELCRGLKNKYEKIPIIMLTAQNDNEIKEKAFQAGCDEFLTKPVSSVELFIRVYNMIKISELSRQLKIRKEIAEDFCRERELETAEKSAKSYNILIIEENDDDRILLEKYLKEKNYSITCAKSGQEALSFLEKRHFDLVLMEILFSDLNGLEILKKIRDTEKTSITPVVIITSHNENTDKIAAIEAGASDYLIKPVDRLELNARISILLKYHDLQNSLLKKYSRAVEQAIRDSMTDLYNNNYFKKFLEIELENARKFPADLTLLMMDLDNFKQYNDTFGHLQGDRVIKQTAEIIAENIRASDFAARYGGEEFAVLLPCTTGKEACAVAERIREEIKKHLNIGISIGVAEFKKGMDVKRFLEKADQALYKAKKQGKNKVVVL